MLCSVELFPYVANSALHLLSHNTALHPLYALQHRMHPPRLGPVHAAYYAHVSGKQLDYVNHSLPEHAIPYELLQQCVNNDLILSDADTWNDTQANVCCSLQYKAQNILLYPQGEPAYACARTVCHVCHVLMLFLARATGTRLLCLPACLLLQVL